METIFDVAACRGQFPSLRRKIDGNPVAYLDGPGGTQIPQSVMEAMMDYYLQSNANTHGQFAASRETTAVVEAARVAMAAMLGAEDPATISFGANMTTLNFSLARAVARSIQPGDEVVVTDLDHDANVAPWLTLAERGAVIRRVPVRSDATLDMDAFAGLLNSKTRLVAVGYASNAVGTVNDVYTVRRWTRELGAWMVLDGVHFVPHGVVDVKRLDPDFLLCSAYKFFGPHVGVLYSRTGALAQLNTDRVRPQRATAPERIETGTLNHAALAGVTAAVQFIAGLSPTSGSLRARLVAAMDWVYAYEHELVDQLYRGLQDMPGIRLYGPPVSGELRAPTLSFTLEGATPETLARYLGDKGIYVWDGDFYAITVIKELGLANRGGLVRVGFAPYNTSNEVERLLLALSEWKHR
ncbi:cysteine desulfurase-like protein [Alicyclobacillaceae bacterium I2511]|nr:cysteine desulfurase-like protein [Alicyclobacillaceae bacterium I2511]